MVKHGVKGENPGDSFFSWSHLIKIDKNLMKVDRNATQRDRKGEKNKLTVSLAIRLICLRCREYIQTEISLTENMSPDKKRPTERWYRWQIPSEQTSRDRGVAWPPLSPQDPPLPTVVTSQQCRFCCSSPTTAAVSEGSRFPTSGTLCCSDEGSDAIRRPASPHQPSLLRLMRECLNEEGEGSGVSDGTRATVVVVVPPFPLSFRSCCACGPYRHRCTAAGFRYRKRQLTARFVGKRAFLTPESPPRPWTFSHVLHLRLLRSVESSLATADTPAGSKQHPA